jgi:hypothetical protein
MLHEYHVIYSVRYYLWFHVIAVGVGTYFPWIRRQIFIYVTSTGSYRLRLVAIFRI